MPRSTYPSPCALTPTTLCFSGPSLLASLCTLWLLLFLALSVSFPTVTATINATVVSNSRLHQLGLAPYNPTRKDVRSGREIVNISNPFYALNAGFQRSPWHGEEDSNAIRKHGMQSLKLISPGMHQIKPHKKIFLDSGHSKRTVAAEPNVPANIFPNNVLNLFSNKRNFAAINYRYNSLENILARQNRNRKSDNTFKTYIKPQKFVYRRNRNLTNSLLTNDKIIRIKSEVSDFKIRSTGNPLKGSILATVRRSKRSASSAKNDDDDGKEHPEIIVNNIKPDNDTEDISSDVGPEYIIGETSPEDKNNAIEIPEESTRQPEDDVDATIESVDSKEKDKSPTTIRSVGENGDPLEESTATTTADDGNYPTSATVTTVMEDGELPTTPTVPTVTGSSEDQVTLAALNRDEQSTVLAALEDEDEELLFEPTESGLWLDGLGNLTIPGNGSVSHGNCTEWTGGKSTTFQIANLMYLTAFLVPHSFRASALLTRCLLSSALVLFCAWAAVHLCALDVLLWDIILLTINLVHAFRLGYVLWPARIQPELRDLYDKLFRPLKVARVPFAQLAREGEVDLLPAGGIYAEEEVTPAATKLTVLLSGRLSVSCDSTHLHYIFPNQFVDSPEWEANHDVEYPTGTFQVTVMADEDCSLLVWPREAIMAAMEEKRSMRSVLQCLIGKDITTKLYSLTEQHHQQQQRRQSRKGRSSPPLLLPGDKTGPARSISVDEVHTSQKGLVRSSAWRANHQVSAHVTHPPVKGYSPRLQRGQLDVDVASMINLKNYLSEMKEEEQQQQQQDEEEYQPQEEQQPSFSADVHHLPATPPRSPHTDHTVLHDPELEVHTSLDLSAEDTSSTVINGANMTHISNDPQPTATVDDGIGSNQLTRKASTITPPNDQDSDDSVEPHKSSVVRFRGVPDPEQ